MRQRGGEISLGDLARAIAASDSSDPQMTAAIARLLGFSLEHLDAAPQLDAPPPLEAAEITPPQLQSDQAAPHDYKEDRPKLPVELPTNERLQYDVTEPDIEHIPAAQSAWPQPAAPWPAWERVAAASPRYRPLFLPQWTRGILSEAAATWRAAGAVDIPRALEVLVRGTTPAELPRVYTPTLARGCQVMVDVSAGMAPFARDCWQLIDALRSVVGREQVQVFYFKDCPIYGVETEADASFVPFQPPPRATPVLLLSDLGIAAPAFSLRRAMVQDWLRLAHHLRVAACPLLALVPYPRKRWPRRLSKELTVIQWDRGTTVAGVRRAKEKH
jgi:hypothetical protein